MGFLELVKKRRSIRSYLDKPIPRKILLQCVEAARLAPSACNAQPWEFVIVDDRKLIVEISEKVCHSIYSINKFIKEAAALVVVVSDKDTFLSKIGGYLKGTNYYLIDIGIACQHLILQAAELGIGSCWIGWFDEKKLKKILRVPSSKRIDVIISLGYCKGQFPSPKQRKELSQIVSFNLSR
jgi:nitroreductase